MKEVPRGYCGWKKKNEGSVGNKTEKERRLQGMSTTMQGSFEGNELSYLFPCSGHKKECPTQKETAETIPRPAEPPRMLQIPKADKQIEAPPCGRGQEEEAREDTPYGGQQPEAKEPTET